MLYTLIIPLMIGTLGVLQNAWNRKIAESWGIAKTVVFNNVTLLIAGIIFWLVVRFFPNHLPEMFRDKPVSELRLFHLLPGLAGLTIIIIAPYVIQRAGAVRVFIGIIAAQIIVSILWDVFVESISVTPTRLAGAALAMMGAYIASL